ncbi:hypothetical protein, partial [Vibrio sp. 03_296]|uniref:hypothetical protein n=1 Tax=Vibrio sp. 03_296 TaxID=2024409 RepID=UPI002D80ADA0
LTIDVLSHTVPEDACRSLAKATYRAVLMSIAGEALPRFSPLLNNLSTNPIANSPKNHTIHLWIK